MENNFSKKNNIQQLKNKIAQLEKSLTKRKQMDEKFKLLSLSVEQLTEGMAHADLNGNLIYVNKAWCEMHEYKSSKNLLGKNLEIFHNKKQLKNDVIPFTDEVKKKGTCSGEVGHITKGGKTFPTLMTSTLLKDTQGNPFAMVGIAKDITELKQAEEALKESEERFRKLSESTFEGIVISDKGKICDANKQLAEMLKIKLDKLIGMNASDFVAPESRKIVEQHIKLGLEEPYEHFAKRSDGSIFPVEVRAKSLPFEGQILRVTAIRDVTERKQAEEKLINRNKELELFNEVTVGRELKMIELKKEINELLKKSGKKPKYKIPI